MSHKFILSMGHRNENRGGANNEINWTPGATRALKEAIIARGGEAWIIQEESGSGSEWYPGGLQSAATACVNLAKTKGPFKAYISMHYNGGASPGFHAIFPDSWSAGDQKANNPLDVRLCRRIRDAVKATNTVRMLSWTADSPGVMSERETGVGAQGYRLGEFYGTLGFRATTARVILEASSIDVASERAYINDPNWVRHVYCEAIVDALEDEFGAFREDGGEAPIEPEQPDTQYATPSFRPALEALKHIDAADIPFMVKDGDDWWFLVDREVQAITDTPRLQYAHPDSAHVGPIIPSGTSFYVWFAVIGADGLPYGYTLWGTRIRLWETDFGVRR